MNDRKLRVLVATHFGEPVGGIVINYRTLLASSYSRRLDVYTVETSQGTLAFSQRGKLRLVNVFNALTNIWRFLFALLRLRPKIVHIGSSCGFSFVKHSVMALLARLLGVIVAFQIHCSADRLLSEHTPTRKRVALFIFRHCNGIVILSKEWHKLHSLLPDAKIQYVPNAIHLQPYCNLARPRPRGDQATVNLLFLGHIGHEKGCFDLVSAVELLRQQTTVPFCLHYVGETLRSYEKEQLQTEVEAKALQSWIQIHEPEYDNRKIARFGRSDIFVLPSYHEGMPMSVIEAMAAGLPVVATKVGGIPEQVVHNQTGFLIEPGDIEALAGAMLLLIEDPKKRLEMGKSGRKRAIAHFDIELKAERLIDFYHQLSSPSE